MTLTRKKPKINSKYLIGKEFYSKGSDHIIYKIQSSLGTNPERLHITWNGGNTHYLASLAIDMFKNGHWIILNKKSSAL